MSYENYSEFLPVPGIPIIHSSWTRSNNRDKVEVYLAYGATRMEACKPIAIEALRLALTPVINQMRSVYNYALL